MNKNVREVIQNDAVIKYDAGQTMLAYFRTAICLVVAGVFLIEVLDTAVAIFSGWLFIVAGVATFLFGVKHHNESGRVRQPVVSSNCSRRFSR